MSDKITSQCSTDSIATKKRKRMSRFINMLKLLIRVIFFQCANRKLN